VRVLDCQGNALTSNVIAGLDWLAQNFQLPAVASLSLGADSPNSAMDDAVKALIALGVTVVVAAGNFNQSKLQKTKQNKTKEKNDAVKALIALGVTVVVAAGNFNQSKMHQTHVLLRLSHAPPDLHSCIRHMCSSRLSHASPDMHSCIRHMCSSRLSQTPPAMHACIRFMCSVHTTP